MIVEFSTADWLAISAGNFVLSQEPGNSAKCRLKQPSSSALLWSTPHRSGFCGGATQVPCSFWDMIWCDPLSLWDAKWPPRSPQPCKQLAVKISTSKATLLFSQLFKLTLRKSMVGLVGLQLGVNSFELSPQVWLSKPTVDSSQRAAVACSCRRLSTLGYLWISMASMDIYGSMIAWSTIPQAQVMSLKDLRSGPWVLPSTISVASWTHGISWYLLSQHFSTYYSMYYNLLLKISLLLSCCSILLDSAGECPPIPTFRCKYIHFKTSSLQATSAPLGLSLWAKF